MAQYSLQTLIVGQLLALLITSTSAITQLLASRNANLPALQNFFAYLGLSTLLCCRPCCTSGSPEVEKVERRKAPAWHSAIIAVFDLTGNWLIVKAYGLGATISSAMLIDALVIPNVMFLSACMLGTRYSSYHYAGVSLCAVGLVTLCFTDGWSTSGDVRSSPEGDSLAALSTMFYAISNVAQQLLVRDRDVYEYQGQIGFFGTILAGALLMGLNSHELRSPALADPENLLLMLLFVVCLGVFNVLAGWLMQAADATVFNLSLLTSDAFGVLVGICMFGQQPSAWFAGAFCFTVTGLLVFNWSPPTNVAPSATVHALVQPATPPLSYVKDAKRVPTSYGTCDETFCL